MHGAPRPTVAPVGDGPAPHPLTGRLPRAVDEALVGPRDRMARQARGRVLVVAGSVPGAVAAGGGDVTVSSGPLARWVGRPDALAVPGSTGARPRDPSTTESRLGAFDTVVSAGGLLGEPDLPAALAALDATLAPGGRLLLAESTRSWRRAVWFGSSLPGVWASTAGLHLGRDLPSALWDAGFAPLTVERFSVRTAILPLRTWGVVSAARMSEVAAGVWA